MAEVDQTRVSIRFSGKDLDTKQVGELLGFIEEESTEVSVRKLKSGRVVWVISLANNDTISLEKKIEALLAKFSNDINVWKLATTNVSADIFCGLFLDGWNRGFELTLNVMKKLSDRNLKIGFDIYAPTESWEKFS